MKLLFSYPLKNKNANSLHQQNILPGENCLPFDLSQPTLGSMWWKALNRLGCDTHIHVYNQNSENEALFKITQQLENWGIRGSTQLKNILQRNALDYGGQKLIQATKSIKPDAVLLFEPELFINSTTIQKLKESTGALVILMMGTSPVAIVHERIKEAAPYFDYIFCNDYYHSLQWLELGAQNVLDLPIAGCDPDFHKELPLSTCEKKEYSVDISFAGRLSPARIYSERLKILEALTDFDLGIWTDDLLVFEAYPRLKPHYKGKARGDKMIKVIGASRIALNLHGHTMQMGGNMRTFEIPGTKTFQLIDRYNPAWFIEGKEIVSFKSPEELKEKVEYYLSHDIELKAITEAGQERVYREHTYAHRATHLLEILKNFPNSRK